MSRPVSLAVGSVLSPPDIRQRYVHARVPPTEKLAAGADLIQVYSGLVYEGPALIRQINEGILKDLTGF